MTTARSAGTRFARLLRWQQLAAVLMGGSFLAPSLAPCDAQVAAPAPTTGLRYDIQFTSTNSTTGNGTPSATSTTGVAHVVMANGKVRIDVAAGQFAAMLGAGDFMIYRDTGHSALVFKPAMAQYVQVDLQTMNAGLTKSINGVSHAVGVKASDVKLNLASLGPGDSIGNLATSKYRLTQDYTVSLSAMGVQGQSSRMRSTTDFWFTPGLSMLVNPFSRVIQETAWLGPDDGTRLSALQAQLPKAVPLKEVTTDVATDSSGARTVSTVTWRLTNFVRASIPDAAFQIPAGYTQMQGGPASLMQAFGGLINGQGPTTGSNGSGAASSGGSTSAPGPSWAGGNSSAAPSSAPSWAGGTGSGAASSSGSTSAPGPSWTGQSPQAGVTGQASQAALDSAARAIGKILRTP